MAVLDRLGEALRVARKVRKLSRQQLSKRTGINKRQIDRYEGGSQSPPPKALGLLLEEMRISLGDLVGLMERMERIAREAHPQFPLFSEPGAVIGEPEVVEQVFYTTRSGKLIHVDDPEVSQVLTQHLLTRHPKRTVVLTLTDRDRRVDASSSAD